jgi:hypothetical protein
MNAHSVEVLLESHEERFFSAILSNEPVVIKARAVATYYENGTACVLALDKTATGALAITGNADITFDGCTVMSNSIDEQSLTVEGSSDLTAPCARAVGGINVSGTLTLTACAEPKEYAPYVRDPYAELPAPSTSGSCENVPKSKHGEAVTVSPGRYCNGFELSGDMTLEPGVYVIDGGTFKINANTDVTGTGVTFYLTDDADLSFNGTADIALSAPTTGTYKGILFYGDREQEDQVHKFNGTANSSLVGALYFPSQSVEVLGDFGGSNGCTQIVALTITFSGSTDYSSDCTGTGIEDITLAGRAMLVE